MLLLEELQKKAQNLNHVEEVAVRSPAKADTPQITSLIQEALDKRRGGIAPQEDNDEYSDWEMDSQDSLGKDKNYKKLTKDEMTALLRNALMEYKAEHPTLDDSYSDDWSDDMSAEEEKHAEDNNEFNSLFTEISLGDIDAQVKEYIKLQKESKIDKEIEDFFVIEKPAKQKAKTLSEHFLGQTQYVGSQLYKKRQQEKLEADNKHLLQEKALRQLQAQVLAEKQRKEDQQNKIYAILDEDSDVELVDHDIIPSAMTEDNSLITIKSPSKRTMPPIPTQLSAASLLVKQRLEQEAYDKYIMQMKQNFELLNLYGQKNYVFDDYINLYQALFGKTLIDQNRLADFNMFFENGFDVSRTPKSLRSAQAYGMEQVRCLFWKDTSEAFRKSTIQKINESHGLQCESINDVYAHIVEKLKQEQEKCMLELNKNFDLLSANSQYKYEREDYLNLYQALFGKSLLEPNQHDDFTLFFEDTFNIDQYPITDLQERKQRCEEARHFFWKIDSGLSQEEEIQARKAQAEFRQKMIQQGNKINKTQCETPYDVYEHVVPMLKKQKQDKESKKHDIELERERNLVSLYEKIMAETSTESKSKQSVVAKDNKTNTTKQKPSL